jgi:hypothetical protein
MSTTCTDVDVLLGSIEDRHRLKDGLSSSGASLSLLENLVGTSLKSRVEFDSFQNTGREGCSEGRKAKQEFESCGHD